MPDPRQEMSDMGKNLAMASPGMRIAQGVAGLGQGVQDNLPSSLQGLYASIVQKAQEFGAQPPDPSQAIGTVLASLKRAFAPDAAAASPDPHDIELPAPPAPRLAPGQRR